LQSVGRSNDPILKWRDMRLALLLLVASWLVAQPAEQQGRSVFRGAPVTFRVLNGRAIFEQDIDLGPADEIDAQNVYPASIYLSSLQGRWPDGVIPYVVDPDIPNAQRILDSAAMWNSSTPILPFIWLRALAS